MKTSKEFYTELGVEGLSKRKKKIHTNKELSYLKKLLKKDQKILDVGCGYGRFTIPLAKQKYDIEGIDITTSLIKKAEEDSKKRGLKIKFKIGDMKKLPYKDYSFNTIICMWSVFTELTKKSEQIKSIREMLRVLKENGMVLIEMTKPIKKSQKIIKNEKAGDEVRIINSSTMAVGKISGIESMPHYLHNKKTLSNLMKKIKVKKFKIFIDNFGGRDRLFLQFWK